MRFQVFGGLRVRRGETALEVGPRHRHTVLAALLVAQGRVLSTSDLVDLVWGDDPPPTAVNQLHRHVGNLRRLLEPDLPPRSAGSWLHSAPSGYRLDTSAAAENDLTRFDDLLARVRAGGPDAPAHCRELAELVRRPLLTGLDPAALVRPHFAALERARRAAATEAVTAATEAGDAAPLLAAVYEVTRSAPFDEPLHAAMVRGLTSVGRRAEALSLFEAVRQRLAEELGVGPSAALRAAQQEALREPDVTAPRASVPTVPPLPTGPDNLPLPVAGFTERPHLTDALANALGRVAGPASTVVITAISGMGGVGKTALAVYWAHQVAERFPDGRLYLNLRGFDPGSPPVDPAEALTMLLVALGEPAENTGEDLPLRAARFRASVAGRRLLLVLDNARDADQVRWLLPGSPGCLVLITSRTRMSSLVVRDGALAVPVDRLAPAQARELLATRLGPDRLAAEPAAVEAVLAACGGLPLALSIAAARVALSPGLTLSDVAAELAPDGDRLAALGLDDGPDTDLRSVFAWSYQALSPDAARLFRLLALHPGPEISLASAASTAGLSVERTQALARDLREANMLTEHSCDRYALHDLLRAYAVDLPAEAVDDRPAALGRLLDHYAHSAAAANNAVSTRHEHYALGPALPGTVVLAFDDRAAGMAWYGAEYRTILTLLRSVADEEQLRRIWNVAFTSRLYTSQQGWAQDEIEILRIALGAPARVSPSDEVVLARLGLARVYAQSGHHAHADAQILPLLSELPALPTELQASVQRSIGWVRGRQGRHREALQHAREALALFQALGHDEHNDNNIARELNAVGWYHALLGEYEEAIRHCEQALPVLRANGNRRGEAATWDSIGYAHHNLGRYRQALECYEQALDGYRFAADEYNQTEVLEHLADTHLALGHHAEARAALHRAADLLTALGHSAADVLRAKAAAVPD
ncbi:tetratricopeptide repeat protein [Streptomyces sp. FH025]|uniref:AfsR/SARP family transcriptional regulator n=1 Tax=Streptomyces sp. FH025 TaxID=2815937 RepID=UPI001A9E3D71|nr:tetratricopeptide repeat protein [Streptomyces sp. FH025]MBO1413745.1 tetratricopeptide repeat protein [Streptomyces sp. FH025]